MADPGRIRFPLVALVVALTLLGLVGCGGSGPTSTATAGSRSIARQRFVRESKALGRRINASPAATAVGELHFDWHDGQPVAKLESILREFIGKQRPYLRQLHSIPTSACVRPFMRRVIGIVAEARRFTRASLWMAERTGDGRLAEDLLRRGIKVIDERAALTRAWLKRYRRSGGDGRC